MRESILFQSLNLVSAVHVIGTLSTSDNKSDEPVFRDSGDRDVECRTLNPIDMQSLTHVHNWFSIIQGRDDCVCRQTLGPIIFGGTSLQIRAFRWLIMRGSELWPVFAREIWRCPVIVVLFNNNEITLINYWRSWAHSLRLTQRALINGIQID